MTQSSENILIMHQPAGERAPAVFDSPHSGFRLPEDWGCTQPRDKLWGWGGIDNYVNELFRDAPGHGAPLLEALYPRSYIDPNRNEDEIDPSMLAEPWPTPLKTGGRVGMGSGLIWRRILPDIPLYDRKLAVSEIKARIENYWRPYQTALKDAMDQAHERFGVIYHFNCHSNRTIAPAGAPEGGGVRRPEMEIGTIDGTTCSPDFTALVRETLEDQGYEVEIDDFNKGEHLIRHYGNPPDGRHSMMLEIRKDLYMDEETMERNDRFAETQANMGKLAKIICEFAKAQAKR
jgi:N-formylglutamate deformylase